MVKVICDVRPSHFSLTQRDEVIRIHRIAVMWHDIFGCFIMSRSMRRGARWVRYRITDFYKHFIAVDPTKIGDEEQTIEFTKDGCSKLRSLE